MGFSVINNKKIVIIGCGAGGGTAAQFARKTDRKAEITIFDKGNYSQYSKCGLPYVISNEISDFKDLIEFSETWFKKENIKLNLDTTVEKIDINNQIIIAKKGKIIIKQEYDKLIFATGAIPSIPKIKNIEKNGKKLGCVYVLRTLDDGKNIVSCVKKDKKATIVGAGLIGLEIADSLVKKNIKVTVIEALPSILQNTIDDDMREPILNEVNNKINIITNHFVKKAEGKNGNIKSITIMDRETKKEKKIQTELLVTATGTKPVVDLAQNIGCRIGVNGGIIVNDRCETSIKNIYAAGDCTEYYDFVTQKPIIIGLGSIAVRQGITAGLNAAGDNHILPKGFLLTRTSKFFGIEIAAVGPVKNKCEKIPIIYAKLKGLSLPDYFPGGQKILMKVGIHEKTGEILTAQAVGPNSAQRINTMACAILNKMHVDDFKKLETAYAPSVAPTLDVLTLVCNVASLKLNRKRK